VAKRLDDDDDDDAVLVVGNDILVGGILNKCASVLDVDNGP
jgi:hypothetical protein